MLDMSQYVFGDGRLYVVTGNWEGAHELMWTRRVPSTNRIEQIKNGNIESFSLTPTGIFRDVDTSPGKYPGTDRDSIYVQFDRVKKTPGAFWMPRYMKKGVRVQRTPLIRWYWRDSGEFIREYEDTSYLEFVEHFPTFSFSTGVVLSDVIKLGWYQTAQSRSAIEYYFYAKNYGLVGWQNDKGMKSQISTFLTDTNSRPMPYLDEWMLNLVTQDIVESQEPVGLPTYFGEPFKVVLTLRALTNFRSRPVVETSTFLKAIPKGRNENVLLYPVSFYNFPYTWVRLGHEGQTGFMVNSFIERIEVVPPAVGGSDIEAHIDRLDEWIERTVEASITLQTILTDIRKS